jgi:hypothetical protein
LNLNYILIVDFFKAEHLFGLISDPHSIFLREVSCDKTSQIAFLKPSVAHRDKLFEGKPMQLLQDLPFSQLSVQKDCIQSVDSLALGLTQVKVFVIFVQFVLDLVENSEGFGRIEVLKMSDGVLYKDLHLIMVSAPRELIVVLAEELSKLQPSHMRHIRELCHLFVDDRLPEDHEELGLCGKAEAVVIGVQFHLVSELGLLEMVIFLVPELKRLAVDDQLRDFGNRLIFGKEIKIFRKQVVLRWKTEAAIREVANFSQLIDKSSSFDVFFRIVYVVILILY